MIEFYAAKTPNGRKIAIMLEECAATYEMRLVDIGKGEQFHPDFTRINPNGKIPAIVDHDAPTPVIVFESAAILIYLAEKFGTLMPQSPPDRAACMSWTIWQVANVGPMFGQAHYFTSRAPEKCAHAIERFSIEAVRLLHVMEQRLSQHAYLAGDYSIADIAVFPWIRVALDPMAKARPDLVGVTPHVRRWFADINARPAVQRGLAMER
jgi:GST-like protein